MKKIFCALAAALLLLAALVGCSTGPDLTEYVSEYRSDLFSGTDGKYTITASYSEREHPYEADGNPGKMSKLFEVALSAADNTKTYSISYTLAGKTYTDELSFDSVRMVHTCSRSLPQPTEKSITFSVTDAEGTVADIGATSVKSEKALSLEDLLQAVSTAEKERFAALTSGNHFAGELYVRLLCENEQNFYYIGLTDKNGETYAMLADAETGEIVATRNNRQD